jgi:oxalate decarboxylase/phosphoglucose isomerase-like protein (cupin superfamily)
VGTTIRKSRDMPNDLLQIVVPPEAPHTFENASDEEAVFFNVRNNP